MARKTFNCANAVASFTVAKATVKDPDECWDQISKEPLNLPAGTYTFKYDYPLEKAVTFTHKVKKQMHLANIMSFGTQDYKRIYREEDASTKVKPGNIPGMLNRNTTDGKYGIWGHGIEDLIFEQVQINTDKKTVYFAIGS